MQDLGDTTTVEWDSASAAIERCYQMGWTDGLPVVPPTVDRVGQFLEHVGRPASAIVGEIPERRREITVGKVAANAVMAGCLPEYLPVVIAATEAMLDPAFNLVGPSSSMGGAAVLVIVNGPVTRQLNINSRNNLFGPGKPGQRHHRPRHKTDPNERLRRSARFVRPQRHRPPRQVHILYRRGRNRYALDAPARNQRICQKTECSHCVCWGESPPGQGPRKPKGHHVCHC